MKKKINKKNKLLCPELIKYIHSIDDISKDEIQISLNLLDIKEKERVHEYRKSIKKNINNKRLFIFICTLIDFKEINNNQKIKGI